MFQWEGGHFGGRVVEPEEIFMQAELDHIVLVSHDVETALAFYLDVVGLEPYRVDEYRRGEVPFPSLRLNAGTLIDLFPPQFWRKDGSEIGPQPNLDHYCMAVAATDWPELLERLESAGVTVELGPTTLHGARGDATAIYARDPDGHKLEFRYYER